jgi:hypothetical protein
LEPPGIRLTVDAKRDALTWLGAWLEALLSDQRIDDEAFRVAVALATLAIKQQTVTADGFSVGDVDNEEVARVARVP